MLAWSGRTKRGGRAQLWRAATLALCVGMGFGACSSPERLPAPPALSAPEDAGTYLDAAGYDGPPPADAGGLCGNDIHQLVTDAPNLYFVLDASGSMGLPPENPPYDHVRIAMVNLVQTLGPRIRVGAAVFPRPVASDTCHAGEHVFPPPPETVQQGDPVTGAEGPTTKALRLATLVQPSGGTPTSPTLSALTPRLTALSGRTIVLLATDGGPNCNENAVCGPEQCPIDCTPVPNCCAPGEDPGPPGCIDEAASVDAVAALAAAGIQVFVIGIPGSESAADVLNAMAIAGGAPQPTAPYYYQVTDVGKLETVFGDIASLVVSCEFEVQDPPQQQGMTNVYLDQEVLPYLDPNGWRWKPTNIVELLGTACERLKSGLVKQVQIVSGCPTEVAK
jgi:hypothetical protein